MLDVNACRKPNTIVADFQPPVRPIRVEHHIDLAERPSGKACFRAFTAAHGRSARKTPPGHVEENGLCAYFDVHLGGVPASQNAALRNTLYQLEMADPSRYSPIDFHRLEAQS